MTMRVHLNEWIKEQTVGDEMLWKGSFGRQMEQMRSLQGSVAFGMDYDDYRDSVAWVISTHRSKSIQLPVVSYERPDLGLQFVIRDNFYNWKLSVISEKPIDDPLFPWLFFTVPPTEPEYTGDSLASCYFEGFPKDLIFGYQSKNPRRWSAEINSYAWLQITLMLCMKAVGAIPMPVWRTKAIADAEFAAEKKRRDAREKKP